MNDIYINKKGSLTKKIDDNIYSLNKILHNNEYVYKTIYDSLSFNNYSYYPDQKDIDTLFIFKGGNLIRYYGLLYHNQIIFHRNNKNSLSLSDVLLHRMGSPVFDSNSDFDFTLLTDKYEYFYNKRIIINANNNYGMCMFDYILYKIKTLHLALENKNLNSFSVSNFISLEHRNFNYIATQNLPTFISNNETLIKEYFHEA
jgi:hypothetical protein